MNQPQRRGAIAVIVRDDGAVLAIERSSTVRAPGRYCFPGGGIEEGESEEEAVRRELREELAVDVEPVRRLWQSTTQSGVLLNWWLAKTSDIPIANPDEVARWFWSSLDELAVHQKTLLSNREFIQAVKTGEIVIADDA